MTKRKTSSAKTKAPAKKRKAPEAKPQEVATRTISATALFSLYSMDSTTKQRVDSITGSLREEIKNAVEAKRLHKGAYAIFKKLYRMEDEPLAELWNHLTVYCDMRTNGRRSIIDRVEGVPRLPLEEDDGGNGDDFVPFDENGDVVMPFPSVA